MASSYHRANIEKEDDIPTFYNWHRKRYKALSIKYEKIRVKYIDSIKQKLKIQALHTIDEKNIPNILNINYDPQNFNLSLIDKNNRLIKKIHKYFISKQEIELKHIVSSKLLNQSFYEKHITIKILEIRNQKSTLAENRKHENDLLLKKLNDNFLKELNQQEHCINLINAQLYSEENRIAEVDKTLHENKILQQHEIHHNTCIEIMDAILDFTIKIKEYENKLTCNISNLVWKEWATSNQTISTIIENINSILYNKENNRNVNISPTKNYESEVTNYLTVKSPWNFEHETDLVGNNLMNLGAKILFHITQKLLLKKYPLSLPDLPKVQTASSVIGILDERISHYLKQQLKIQNITLVHLHKAITFCIREYVKEKKWERKYKLKLEQINEYDYFDRPNNSLVSFVEYGEEEIMGYIKETQTSDIFYAGDFKYSQQAELGKCAYLILTEGLALNSRLVTALLLQYLKSLKNINGWVLENYPEVLEDAIHLELGLTGKLVHNEICEENIINDNSNEHLKRVSQLDSKKSSTALIGNKSYLTSFVHLIKNSKHKTVQECITPTDSFFLELGCNNFLSYYKYNPELIKQLLILIKQDKVFENEIYDLIVDTALDRIELDQKIPKTVKEIQKSSSKGAKKKNKEVDKKLKDKKIDKKSLKGKSIDKTRVTKDVKSIDSRQQKSITEEDKSILPGDSRWIYIDLPQTEFTQKRLATMWNNTETAYLNYFTELLLSKRIYEYSLLPYMIRTDTYMTNLIEKPNDIQTNLISFQEMYNNLENYLREDDEFKAELYCRIAELKTILNELCLQKMTDAESERIKLINENWFSTETVSLLNIYVSAMQTELNRCVQTLQLFQAYYTSMLGQDSIENKFKTTTLDLFKYTDSKIQMTVANFFINSSITTVDPVINILNNQLTTSNNLANSWNSLAEGYVNNLGTSKGKDKNDTKKSKKKSDVKKLRTSEPSQSHDITQNILKLKQEYLYAIKGELHRVKFRLNLIIAKSKVDIAELLSNGKRLFTKLHERLVRKYEEDLSNINSICEVFCKSVESCEKLEECLVIQNSELYYDDESIFEL